MQLLIVCMQCLCSIICMQDQPMVIIRHQFVCAHMHRFCFFWECACKYLITFLCCSCVLALDRGRNELINNH